MNYSGKWVHLFFSSICPKSACFQEQTFSNLTRYEVFFLLDITPLNHKSKPYYITYFWKTWMWRQIKKIKQMSLT